MNSPRHLLWGNPEFIRNVWLEISPQRLVIAPILIAMLALLIVLGNTDHVYKSLCSAALTCFFLATVIWGGRLASETLTQEFAQGTWDGQRMSGLTPGQMLCGKLFGGTLFVWYIGAILIAQYLFAGRLAGETWSTLLKYSAAIVCAALAFHSIIMMLILSSWRKQGGRILARMRYVSVAPWLILLLLVPQMVLWSISHSRSANHTIWFGSTWSVPDLMLLTLAALTVWLIIGVWLQLRAELQYRNGPWAWFLFLLFWMGWLAGFVGEAWGRFPDKTFSTPWLSYLAVCGISVLATVYLQLFHERHDAMTWLRLTSVWRQRNRMRLQSLIPAWSVSYALGILIMVAMAMLAAIELTGTQTLKIILSAIGLLAFVLRDIALILWFNLARDTRRADGAAFICLLVLYMLLPLLAELTIGNAGGLFYPSVLSSGASALFVLSPVIQAAIMLWLLKRRWRQLIMPAGHGIFPERHS